MMVMMMMIIQTPVLVWPTVLTFARWRWDLNSSSAFCFFHNWNWAWQNNLLFRLLFGPHRLHAVRRCGPFVYMSHVAWYVCWYVGHGHTDRLCEKNNDWTNWGTDWRQTQVGPKNLVLWTWSLYFVLYLVCIYASAAVSLCRYRIFGE